MSMLITSVVSDSLRPYELARQALLSLGFSGHESWGGLPCPPPGDLPDPGTGPASLCLLHWQTVFSTPSATWEAHVVICYVTL